MDATTRTVAPVLRAVLVTVLAGTGLAGLAWWLKEPYEPQPATVVPIICDRSDSMLGDPKCRAIEGIASRVLSTPHLGKGSRIVVYGTGSPDTAMEPVLIGSYDIPVSNRVMEGRDTAKVARRALLDTIVADCKEAATMTTSSPIFLAVKRAMEQLSAAGCGTKSVCRLYVRTDGEETVEPWLRESIRGGKTKPSATPVPLDNGNIAVTFCGLAETVGEVKTDKKGHRVALKKSGSDVEVLQAAWRKVWTEPDAVVFEPFCPQPGSERGSD